MRLQPDQSQAVQVAYNMLPICDELQIGLARVPQQLLHGGLPPLGC